MNGLSLGIGRKKECMYLISKGEMEITDAIGHVKQRRVSFV